MTSRYIVDCGHGGSVAASRSSAIGAVGPRGLQEKDVTLRIGARVVHHLGGEAALTRDGDRNLSLADRAAVAWRHGAAVFVSLHANAGAPGERGAETWVHARANQASRRLAGAIQQGLARLGGPDRGVHAGELAVLSPERLPTGTAACLVEVDFLSDPAGERRLGDPAEVDRIARSIAGAIRRFGARDAKGNDVRLVELERRLFRVLRENQSVFRAAVAKVVQHARGMVLAYESEFGLDRDLGKLLKVLRREEMFTPEFVEACGGAMGSDAEALERWQRLVHTDWLERASVDLQMGFLRIVFDVFLDDSDKKSDTGALARMMATIGRFEHPEAPRGKQKGATGVLAELGAYFRDRGRDRQEVTELRPIVGNEAVLPDMCVELRPFLDPTDPAFTALVRRGADVWVLRRDNPFYRRLEELGLPHAAGVSGSAADFVAFAKMARLSRDEMAAFAMAILCFIGLPGHHSFAEIAFVLAANGMIAFDPRPHHGDYAGALTDALKATDGYRALERAFPEQLLTS